MNDKDFLSRWSRRKRAAEVTPDSLSPAPIANPTEGEDVRSVVESEAKSGDESDLSTLPSLDSITEASDVTAFLRKGVPAALTREALRRAWLADPAIRDFVGLAENAWDFNDPNAMPGFGPLDYTPEQMRDLVARIVDDGKRVVEKVSSAAQPQQDSVMTKDVEGMACAELPDETIACAAETGAAQAENGTEGTESVDVSAASSQKFPAAVQDSQLDALSVVRRTHGGALPR